MTEDDAYDADELIACPKGHWVLPESLIPRDGKTYCPVCQEIRLAAAGPAAKAPRAWSRTALAPALVFVAVGEAMLAVSQYEGLRDYEGGLHLVLSSPHVAEFFWAVLGHVALAVAALVAAVVVGRQHSG